MTDLPCMVAIVLVVVFFGTVADSAYVCESKTETPVLNRTAQALCFEKVETGSRMHDEERRSAVDAVNLYRAFIANQCDKFKSGKPKSANFRKIQYSCALEQEVAFDCPANANDEFKMSGKVFRHIEMNYAGSIFYRIAPNVENIEIDGNTLDFKDNSVRLSQTMRFYLNGDATEIGCYQKVCHDKDYIACTTGIKILTRGPLYTAGARCRSNKDCLDTGYPICDMEYGLCDKAWCQKDADCIDPTSPVCNLELSLCGPLVCKFSDSSLTVDACKSLRQCTETTGRTESERHFCRSTVIIAERNKVTNTFTVEGFGAAVGEKYLLTSVSAEFPKYEATDLYAIVGGSAVFPLRKDGVNPQMHHGSFDINAWQDLILVKLADQSAFEFKDHLKIKKASQNESESGSQDDLLTVCPHLEGIIVENIILKTDGECETIFDEDPFADYVGNSNMACGRYDHDIGTRFLSGAPLVDVALTDGHYTLRGIRSEPANSPGYSNGFLVTKLAPNCEWLESVSGGDVKCI